MSIVVAIRLVGPTLHTVCQIYLFPVGTHKEQPSFTMNKKYQDG